MARKIDLTKPLSKKTITHLRERYPDVYVERMIALAGTVDGPEEDEKTLGGDGNGDGANTPENPGEDLIGDLDGGSSDEENVEVFDPNVHTADEVVTYLKSASSEEKERVQSVEADGKGRSTILNA